MGMVDNLEIKQKSELTEKQMAKADAFILKDSTTGEFINTFQYLGYHPEGRFQDDSIVIFDKGSGEVRGVMMAARGDNDSIISYPELPLPDRLWTGRLSWRRQRRCWTGCLVIMRANIAR